MGLAAAVRTKVRERAPKRGHQSNLMSELPEPLDGDPSTVYFPGACYQLYPVVLPCFPDGDQHYLHDDHSRQRQRTEGVLALSLANRIRLPSTPSGIPIHHSIRRALWRHLRTSCLDSALSPPWPPRKRSSPNSMIPYTEYVFVDPLHLAAQSIASEPNAYEMLQSLCDCLQ